MESEGAFPASLGDTTLTVDDLTDPWGNPYSYSPTPDSANWLLTSSGPDGTPGTEDDVVMDGYLHSTAAYIIYETQKMVTGFGAPRQVSDSMSASINVARLTIAVRRYREAHDTLPASLDDVPGLVEWMRIDPWDHPYELIVREDGSFYVRSLGADGTPGTRDDLTIDNSSVRVEMSP